MRAESGALRSDRLRVVEAKPYKVTLVVDRECGRSMCRSLRVHCPLFSVQCQCSECCECDSVAQHSASALFVRAPLVDRVLSGVKYLSSQLHSTQLSLPSASASASGLSFASASASRVLASLFARRSNRIWRRSVSHCTVHCTPIHLTNNRTLCAAESRRIC